MVLFPQIADRLLEQISVVVTEEDAQHPHFATVCQDLPDPVRRMPAASS
jgi:hypothetical protein